MDNQDFNGYSNYETWLTALHLHDDYEAYNAVLANMKKCATRYQFARLIRIQVNNHQQTFISFINLWNYEKKKRQLDYEKINWDEIAESFESDGSYRPKRQGEV